MMEDNICLKCPKHCDGWCRILGIVRVDSSPMCQYGKYLLRQAKAAAEVENTENERKP